MKKRPALDILATIGFLCVGITLGYILAMVLGIK